MITITRRGMGLAAAAATLAPGALARAQGEEREQADKIDLRDRARGIGDGLTLHYVEAGQGAPVIFVHGSLSDYTYWDDQLEPFSRSYRAIAYSRRYNFPNANPSRAGYSAIADAQDLERFIERLRLPWAHIVGHSYGALTALFLATRRPDLVRTLTLAEPPAVSLLDHVPPPNTAAGFAMLADIQARMVVPMTEAFRAGERERGVRIFIDYVMDRPGAWNAMSAASHAETLRDAHEWDVMMTTGTLFPHIDPAAVRRVGAPTLLLSGAKSYPFLGLIDEALVNLLPNQRRIVFPRANHQMWLQEPVACREAVLQLVRSAAAS